MSRSGSRLLWIGFAYLMISSGARAGLALFSGEAFAAGQWLEFMAKGAVFDLVVLPWFLAPWAVYELITPNFQPGGLMARLEKLWAALWAVIFLIVFCIITASEFAFWAEFGSRFDFIAVDYLIYTHEVIGNIRESYPVGLWIGAIALISVVIIRMTWPGRVDRQCMTLKGQARQLLGIVAAAGIGYVAIGPEFAESKSDATIEQLSENGVYAFVHAYRHNQLDYGKYYPTLDKRELDNQIRHLVSQTNSDFSSGSGIDRVITSDSVQRKTNVVLISVESLSADYLGVFGNRQNLTPELDKLARYGRLFTRLYATGTRTVRGLEALSLGTPPTPGQSIIRRPDNDNLENIGEELAENGWAPYWVYGGYGIFDNMNAYFGSNGYSVVDRSDMGAEHLPVHAENIWGIADEDLFSLAFTRLDREYASGRRFFAHIMTTSNHRPYTFPEGRIDLPQGKREGAVKYTDWAIGNFIRRSADKPWFANTLFVIVADHTAKAAGKTDLPPSRYHIPMIWYAPGLVEPGRMDRLMSQVDVGPTLLGWLGVGYSSRFFGYDMAILEPGRERAFISTYQKLGYLKNERLVTLDVNRSPVVTTALEAVSGGLVIQNDDQLTTEAIAWYQAASLFFQNGDMKENERERDGLATGNRVIGVVASPVE
tara:strand:+ start:3073 stop:5034 length:1962 start_codon:yes stop_codon:yes gene_type:complete